MPIEKKIYSLMKYSEIAFSQTKIWYTRIVRVQDELTLQRTNPVTGLTTLFIKVPNSGLNDRSSMFFTSILSVYLPINIYFYLFNVCLSICLYLYVCLSMY